MPEPENKMCALCEREVQNLSLHHLVPREEGGRYSEKVPLCQPCHTTLHLTFTNKELARHYHTIPALQEAAPLQKYLTWIRTKRIEKISNRRGRRR
ncbi:hypothetical protein BH24BAC1_BH24BAC1_36770 [soil metagenome]